jgi:hypothetical protein
MIMRLHVQEIYQEILTENRQRLDGVRVSQVEMKGVEHTISDEQVQ